MIILTLLSLAAILLAIYACWNTQRSRKNLIKLLNNVKELHPQLNQPHLSIGTAYRTAKIDESPSVRELYDRLKDVEEKIKLPVLTSGRPGYRYCIDCKYRLVAKDHDQICGVHPHPKGGFHLCGAINEKHDCKHYSPKNKQDK